jgi:hypothetical protein
MSHLVTTPLGSGSQLPVSDNLDEATAEDCRQRLIASGVVARKLRFEARPLLWEVTDNLVGGNVVQTGVDEQTARITVAARFAAGNVGRARLIGAA